MSRSEKEEYLRENFIDAIVDCRMGVEDMSEFARRFDDNKIFKEIFIRWSRTGREVFFIKKVGFVNIHVRSEPPGFWGVTKKVITDFKYENKNGEMVSLVKSEKTLFNDDRRKQLPDSYQSPWLSVIIISIILSTVILYLNIRSRKNKIRLFANKLMPKQFALKNGQATYEWVKGFNKAAHFGGKTEIKAPTVKSSGDDDRLNLSISVDKLEEELDKLNESLESGEMQFEEFEGKEKILEDKIAKAKIAEKSETKEPSKSKKKKDEPFTD